MTSTDAQVSVPIGLPAVDIGINVQVYRPLVQVPGYPVYYAPRASQDFFFRDESHTGYSTETAGT